MAGARDLHLVVASSRAWPPGYRRLARLTSILAMQINMRDGESIAAWYEGFSARHGPQRAAMRALRTVLQLLNPYTVRGGSEQ